MMSTEMHFCRGCGKRLPVSNLVGSATVQCRYCKETTRVPVVVVVRPMSMAREQC